MYVRERVVAIEGLSDTGTVALARKIIKSRLMNAEQR
jgi:hypothetical protein